MSGRRFVWRWSARVLRREWRQHLVILVLLTTGVAISVTGALAAYNLTSPPETDFGGGQFSATSSDPDQLARLLIDQRHPFGTIASTVIGRDNTTERVNARRIDPDNEVTAPLIDLLDGRWPEGDHEVAVTDRSLAGDPALGSTVIMAGQELEIVGFVENPTQLSDEFVLIPDLTVVAGSGQTVSTDFLIDAAVEEVDFGSLPDSGVSETDGDTARTVATLIVNVIGALGMLEVALLVGSAFAVIAKRKSRQFGLLAAAGAPPRLIRVAASSSGAILGVVGAAVGLTIGVLVAALLIPAMETTVGRRISFAVPLWGVLPSAVIAILVTTLAARRPASALARLSVVDMLASTRPKPEPVGRAAVVGVGLAAVGGVALVAGFTKVNTALALLGTLLTPIGLLLLAPLVVKMLAHIAAKLPLSERLAARTIGRYNRRSASVVAAIALALAIPMGIGVVTGSIDARAEDRGPNVRDDQMIVWTPGGDGVAPRVPASVDEAALATSKNAVQMAAPDISFVPIEVAVPKERGLEAEVDGIVQTSTIVAVKRLDAECNFCDLDSFGFGDRDEDGDEISYEARISWLASPALLDALDLDDAWLNSSNLALVQEVGLKVAWYEGILAEGEEIAVSPEWPANEAVPSVLISPGLVDMEIFDIVTIGWLGTSPGQISSETKQSIVDSLTANVVLEFQESSEPRSTLRTIGLLVGILVGVGMTVSSIGLLSAELASDTALLASLGAPPRTGRRMSAALAAQLALAGALLALPIGYAPLLPMVLSRADGFSFVVPWPIVGGLLILFPAVAGAAGWMMSRRSTKGLSLRQFV